MFYLDYGVNLAVLASTQARIRDKTEKIWQTARRVGLEINAPKTKVMCSNTTFDVHLTVAGETLKYVDIFRYLGSVIRRDGSTQKDIKNRQKNNYGDVWATNSGNIPGIFRELLRQFFFRVHA